MRHIDQMNQTQEEDFSHMYKERLFQMHILEQRMIRHQQETPRQYYNLLVQILRHPQLNRFTNKKVPPPPPPLRELTEEEKARITKELAKLKDCCQMYSFRYAEPRRSRNRGKKVEQGEEETSASTGEEVPSSMPTSNEGEANKSSPQRTAASTTSKPGSVPGTAPTSQEGGENRNSSSKGSGGSGPPPPGETVVAKL